MSSTSDERQLDIAMFSIVIVNFWNEITNDTVGSVLMMPDAGFSVHQETLSRWIAKVNFDFMLS